MTLGSIFGKSFKLPQLKPKTPTKGPGVIWRVPAKAAPVGRAPDVDWTSVTDVHLYKWSNDPARFTRPRGIFHPSSGLHPDTAGCHRELVFELIYAPMSATQVPANLRKILDNGTDRHEGLQTMFANMASYGHMGIAKSEKEIKLSHPVLPLAGSMDLRLTMKSGHTYVFDFKTKVAKQCEDLYAPIWSHVIQLQTYMGMSGDKTGYMLYENKDNQKWVGPMGKFRVDFDSKLYSEIEDFCTDILKWVEAEEMPPFEEKVCKASLTFCKYRVTCEAERKGTLAWAEYDHRTSEQKNRQLKVFQE